MAEKKWQKCRAIFCKTCIFSPFQYQSFLNMKNPFSGPDVVADDFFFSDTAGLLNSLPDAILLLTTSFKLATCNKVAQEKIRVNHTCSLTPGLSLPDLVPGRQSAFFKTLLQDVLAGRPRTIDGFPGLALEGEEDCACSFLPVFDESGQVSAITLSVRRKHVQSEADRAIQEAEERWQFAFEASNQAAWDWNMQTNEVIYSNSYKKMYGFLGDELSNDLSEWEKRIHPDDRGRIEAAVREHTQSDNPYYETTYRIQLKNGDYKWIMARGKLLSKDGQGQPLRMIGTHTDLTQTLNTKEEIRQMNERFHYAARASSQALWEWNAVNGEAYVSPSFTEMFGWKADDNKHFDQWHQYVHPDDREATVAGYYRFLNQSTESIWESTYRFLKADGSYAFVNDRAYVLRDKTGKATKVIGATQDVTALKKAEEELVRSNQRYHNVLKATNELIWEWDMKTGEVFRPRESIQKVYGIEDETAVQTVSQWLSRIHPDDLERVNQTMAEIMRGCHQQTFELAYRFRRDDGGYNDIHGRGILLHDDDGQPVRMIGSEQNISERKRLEHELLQNELEMKKRINQATVDSQEQERTEIGRELHDNINQVLTTTKLYLELALESRDMAEELLRKSAANIGQVIAEIRQLSRSLMDPTIGDLGIVESVNDLIANINLTGKVHISFSVEPSIEILLSKKQKLTIFRIIQEALNNVIRHANATFVAVDIRRTNEAVDLVIKDDGTGFEPALIKKGAGLKNISNRAYLINGNFTLESKPGGGCAVNITFPIKNDQQKFE